MNNFFGFSFQIVEYLRQVAANRSDIATLLDFGPSEEGRVIYGLRISSGGTNKPIILIEGTIHAREWIVPTTVLYFINELIFNTANSGLFSAVDFYFIPVLNPDGYEFTHTDVSIPIFLISGKLTRCHTSLDCIHLTSAISVSSLEENAQG